MKGRGFELRPFAFLDTNYCTVRFVEEVIPFKVAVIVVVPGATPVAMPVDPIVAMVGSLELQVTEVVTVDVVPSEYAAVAVNGWVLPVVMVVLVGDTVSSFKTLLLTVSVVLCVKLPSVAVIVVFPSATPVASPFASIVAMAGFEDVQVTVEEISRVLPSPKEPLAENCCVALGCTETFSGLIVNEDRSFGPIKKLSHAARTSNISSAVISKTRLQSAGMAKLLGTGTFIFRR